MNTGGWREMQGGGEGKNQRVNMTMTVMMKTGLDGWREHRRQINLPKRYLQRVSEPDGENVSKRADK